MNAPRRVPGRLRPRTTPAPAPTTTDPAPDRTHAPETHDPVDPAVAQTTPQGDTGDTTPVLYTPEQAAAMLQVRPSWLRRRAAARAVPCRFLGKHLRFAKQDIDEIAAASRQPPRNPVVPVTRYGKPS